jgi:signal transduction histidine kinase
MTNAFTPDDILVLQILTDQVAIAVENARSYELAQKAVEEMREVDRLKSQFLANMSHELRTPLNSIIGFSRVILKGIDGPITDLQQQDLTAIYSSGNHLLGLINDVLDVSKIEAGKMELGFEDQVNLNDMVTSVMSTTVGLVKDKPIKLLKQLAPNLPTVRADPMKVRQVMINLLSNAAKFTEEGSITIKTETVEIGKGKHLRPAVRISVTDTGHGIASADQVKLFQPFSQVDGSLTRKTGGTGLGLSISQHLVNMHGGRIWLESVVGKGTTFFFTLPVTGPLPEGEDEENGENSVTTAAGPPVILAVEPERLVIGLYQRYLSNHKLEIVALTELDQTMEQARKIQPQIILLDVAMRSGGNGNAGAATTAALDGWQVLRDLKNDPATHHIPVIICTILEEQEKGMNLGASAYLVKPILEDDLVQAVDSLFMRFTDRNTKP